VILEDGPARSKALGLYCGGVFAGESFVGDMDLARSMIDSCQWQHMGAQHFPFL
jgi:hypothetical protein